jgi:hypothetical protein
MSNTNRVLSVEAFQDYCAAMSGTSFQGQINIRYGDLVRLFGKPLPGDEYKTQAEWILRFHDYNDDRYIDVTIYDWKVGVPYCGEEHGIPATAVTTWHVGGRSKDALYVLQDWLAMTNFHSLVA